MGRPAQYILLCSLLACMSRQLHGGSHWDQLSDELSSMIFTIAARLIVEQERGSRELYKLPMVCTRFASVFKQHPYLHECIKISRIASTSLPSLLIWIRQYGSHVKTYIHFQDCSVQVVLGTLLSRDAPLRMVELDAPSEAIPLVSAFTTLQQCKLHSSSGKLDLEPLQALPNLHDLYLADGDFHNMRLRD